MDILQWKKELTDKAQPERKAILSSFFKTGKGQYGEGDVFIGLYVPDNRAISKKYHKLPLEIIGELLKDKIHEFRLAALIALVKSIRHKRMNKAARILWSSTWQIPTE